MTILRDISIMLLFMPLAHYVSFSNLLWLSVLGGLLWFTSVKLLKRRYVVHVGGWTKQGFEEVAQVFRKSVERGEEQGAAFAVYYRGELVVDLWGGYADYAARRLRQEDSISMFYSSTKAVTAIVIAVLVDRGLLDYEKPVAYYWPEFAENGKSSILLKTLLSHQAGLIRIKEKHSLSMLRDDPEELSRLLAKQKPEWPPGTAEGYQALTYGLYADEIVRRVDPKHRSLSVFYLEEIGQPYDIDFYIGEPKELHHRACRESRAKFGWGHFFKQTIPIGATFLWRSLYSIIVYRTVHLSKFIGNPTDWKARSMNDPSFRQLGCGSSHGFGTARGVAKLMGILGIGGTYQGNKLLSKERIEYLNQAQTSGFDVVVLKNISYGPGTCLMDVESDGNEHQVFGHWGAGGQMAFADPQCELGWSYVTNYSNILHGFIIDHRYLALQNATYRCLRQLNKNQ